MVKARNESMIIMTTMIMIVTMMMTTIMTMMMTMTVVSSGHLPLGTQVLHLSHQGANMQTFLSL